MDAAYVNALETRTRWLRWALAGKTDKGVTPFEQQNLRVATPIYITCLERGDTFYMNERFCQLTDFARQTVPDDLVWESNWLQTKQGWMWLEHPFEVPNIADLDPKTHRTPKISAIAWFQPPEGSRIGSIIDSGDGRSVIRDKVTQLGATQFLCYMDQGLYDEGEGFSSWSFFMLCDGDVLINRIHFFESATTVGGGAYPKGRVSDMMHEIRWIYTAFHLMAQKLRATVHHPADRAQRRRMERNKTEFPPLVKVITLRRMEEARTKEAKPGSVDWQWQWRVEGFWRNQYYPSENVHKRIWIEDYIKGPPDKPLKPPQHKLYAAVR